MNFNQPRTPSPEDRDPMKFWYDKARAKVESFVTGLDPKLKVEVISGKIITAGGEEKKTTIILRFSHDTDPRLKWSMEINPNDDYIDNKLEGVVRNIYSKRIGYLSV